MLVNSSSSFLIRTFIFLFHFILKDNTCRVRAFQCVKSTKMYIFIPDSHSLFQVRQKNAKNCHFEACYGVAISVRSFIYIRMKRKILNRKFWLRNRTSDPPNGLNFYIFHKKGLNFEINFSLKFQDRRARIFKGHFQLYLGLWKSYPPSGKISN